MTLFGCRKRLGGGMLRTGVGLALVLCVHHGAIATERFPQPEFDSDYRIPIVASPSPRIVLGEYVDVAVFLAALVLATYLALRRRSRKGLVALTLFSLIYFGFWRKGCVCAVGAVQNIVVAVTDPAYTLPVPVLLFFALPLLFALFFGRTFCAAVCPLGAVQEISVLKPIRVPAWLAHGLRIIPLAYLGLAILFAATGSGFFICRGDPYVSFFRLSAHPLPPLLLGLLLLLLGTVIARPYCRFLCPYGVLLGWCSKFAKWHVTITPDDCIQCRLCADSCPFGAILPASAEPSAEPRPVGIRRLAVLLCLWPLLIVGGGLCGRHLSPLLARANETVRLAEQIRRENAGELREQTLASEAFRAAGTPVTELYADAWRRQAQFRVGGTLFGALLGAFIGGKLILLSLRRRRSDYEPDRTVCYSCGRCFQYCPQEQVRRRRQETSRSRSTKGTSG